MATEYRWLHVLGGVLRERRVEQVSSLRMFARQIGQDHSYMSRVEAGTKTPSANLINAYETALALDPGSIVADAESRYPRRKVAKPVPPGPGPSDATAARLTLTIEGPWDGVVNLEARLEVAAIARCEDVRLGLLGPEAGIARLQGIEPPARVELARTVSPVPSLVVTIAEQFYAGERMTWKFTLRTTYLSGRLFVFPVEGTWIEQLTFDFETYGVEYEVFLVNRLEYLLEDMSSNSRLLAPDVVEVISEDARPPINIADLELGRAYGLQWCERNEA